MMTSSKMAPVCLHTKCRFHHLQRFPDCSCYYFATDLGTGHKDTVVIKCIYLLLDQLAKPTFRSRYAHTPVVTEQSEGPIDTIASNLLRRFSQVFDLFI